VSNLFIQKLYKKGLTKVFNYKNEFNAVKSSIDTYQIINKTFAVKDLRAFVGSAAVFYLKSTKKSV